MLILLISIFVGCDNAGDPRWTSYRSNVWNQGWLTSNGNFQVGAAWTFTAEGQIWSTPVTGSDGTIYVGSCNKVYALDPQNGAKKWEFATGDCALSVTYSHSTGLVYIGSRDTKVYALESANGGLKWTFQTRGPITSAPVHYNGKVYVTSYDQFLYALSDTGTQVWSAWLGNVITSTPAVWTDDTVIVGSEDGNIYAFNRHGLEKWKFQTNGPVTASPAIDTTMGRVLIGSFDGKMYSLDIKNGNKVWEYAAKDRITGSAIVYQSNVYFADEGARLYGLNANGAQLWTPSGFLDRPGGSPVMNLSNGLIYLTAYHSLWQLNPANFTRKYLGEAEGLIRDAAIGPNGMVLVGSWDNNLYALR